MQHYIFKYFSLYKKLSLPGIGSFFTEIIPAQLNFIDKTLYPPSSIIRFRSDDASVNDHFIKFLSDEMSTDEISVVIKTGYFIESVKTSLENYEPVAFEGIGILEKRPDGDYAFAPLQNFSPVYTEVKAERVIRKNASHTVKVGEDEKTSVEMQEQLSQEINVTKDYWWVYAIILAAIGIGTIAFYYASK